MIIESVPGTVSKSKKIYSFVVEAVKPNVVAKNVTPLITSLFFSTQSPEFQPISAPPANSYIFLPPTDLNLISSSANTSSS